MSFSNFWFSSPLIIAQAVIANVPVFFACRPKAESHQYLPESFSPHAWFYHNTSEYSVFRLKPVPGRPAKNKFCPYRHPDLYNDPQQQGGQDDHSGFEGPPDRFSTDFTSAFGVAAAGLSDPFYFLYYRLLTSPCVFFFRLNSNGIVPRV